MAKSVKHAPVSDSMAEVAHKRLEEMIVTLQLPPGSHWSEENLSEKIRVGRTPVREAVKRLQADSLISILPRHGLMITEIDVQQQLLVIDFRRELEIFISTRAARRILAPSREHLASTADEIETAGRQSNREKYLQGVFDANLAIAKAAGNPFAARSISPLHALSRRFYYKYESDLQNLKEMGRLHAERARAVSRQEENAVRDTVTALMNQIEDCTRKVFELNFGPSPVRAVR
jgi:DNA-binding GntR family transcriptional regulator